MFRQIRRRFCTEISCLHFATVGIFAGAALLFGAVFSTGLSLYPLYVCFPTGRVASFFYTLLHLLSYALLGAALGIAVAVREPLLTCKRDKTYKTASIFVLSVTLVLSYLWIPVVCKACSFFLGVLLCCAVLLLLAAAFFLLRKISILAAALLIFFSLWELYLAYTAFSMLFVF